MNEREWDPVPESDRDIDPRLARLVADAANRVSRGEDVDWPSLRARHPEFQQQLECVAPMLQALAELSPSRAGGSTSRVASAITADLRPTEIGTILGDFRILRELGRGGMGIVYEAEQEALGRRVALKVLPFAAVLDARQLARFKNEAHAAALLQHQSIVPVYSVGCDRGVHYYAMQYIEGRTLVELIDQLRQLRREVSGTQRPDTPQPTPPEAASPSPGSSEAQVGTASDRRATSRSQCAELPIQNISTTEQLESVAFCRAVARLGIEAAEALDHAHLSGIVHRDIKPGNLLVDGNGHLWITDFGLARIGTDVGLTQTGDVLGTLRYMSPEQALARRVVADHRTDIYSLGITLYELLTLEPAYPGHDRQELLRQIAQDEPLAPSRRNPRIPHDLETIVLKAMAKEPDQRYETARQMADDLQRFLEDKTIAARRPSLRQRLARHSRRHRAVLTAIAATLVLAAIVSAGFLWRAYSIAVAERARAETSLQFAKSAVDTMYTRFAEQWLGNDLALTDMQREFLEKAAEFYEQMYSQDDGRPDHQWAIALAKLRVGRIHLRLARGNHRHIAARNLKTAQALLESLTQRFPDNYEYQRALAECHYESAVSVLDNPSRIQHLHAAQAILRPLVEEDSNEQDRQLLYYACQVEGLLLVDEQHPEEAKRLFMECAEILDKMADDEFRQKLIDEDADLLHEYVPEFMPDEDRDEDRLAAHQRRVESARTRLLEHPSDLGSWWLLTGELNKLGTERAHLDGDTAETFVLFEESVRTALNVIKKSPEHYRGVAPYVIPKCCSDLQLCADTCRDEAMWRRAIDVLEQILNCLPTDARHTQTDPDDLGNRYPAVSESLAQNYQGLACFLAENGRMEEAIAIVGQFNDLMSQRDQLVSKDQWPSWHVGLANMQLCEMFVQQQRPTDAYRHLLTVARHAHVFLGPRPREDLDSTRMTEHPVECGEMTKRGYLAASEAWGPGAVLEACRDAVARKEYTRDELLLVQVMADAEMGNHARVLDQLAPMIDQADSIPIETLLETLAALARDFHDHNSQVAVCELVQKLLELRQGKKGSDRWDSFFLGATTHFALAGTYQDLQDWPHVIEHGQLAAQHYERGFEQPGPTVVHGDDLRRQIGRAHLMCANAHFQQRDYDRSAEAASLAVARFQEFLADRPQDQEGRRELAHVLYRQGEASYLAGRTDDARKAYEESLQAMRELIAQQAETPELEDQRMLCGMLTRCPFSLPGATDEAQQISQLLLKSAPDDPVVWYETAWVDLRRGSLEAAHSGFQRFLESTPSTAEQQAAPNVRKTKSCLDAMRETAEQRQRIATAGCALAEYGLGNSDAAKESFRQAVEQFEAARDHTVFSLQEHSTLLEAARLLQQENVVDHLLRAAE